ncbi:hypothetical protein H0H92_014532 [Tricholoma furcatifolium]|nr:hypothetical protein H0H92_014532 [Tricholoma furcatifolium]
MSQSSRSSITLDYHDPSLGTTAPTNATMAPVSQVARPDIEHMPVANDPRAWSPLRKNLSLTMIASASMIAGLSGSIQNPAVEQMQAQLPATSGQFSWSVSAFILVQGLMPLVWSAISEVKGRKIFLVSSSAVITIGAATLADMFEPAERGTKMGIYYMAPLLGPLPPQSIGPLLGGGLTTGLGWRAIFWFLSIVSGSICVCFIIFFRDTFRKERSLIYQNVLRQRLEEAHKEEKVSDKGQNPDPEKGGVPLEINLSLRDVNPGKPLILVLRRINNIPILIASGLLFAFGFLIAYTTARTLGSVYNYSALKIGLVLVAFGVGSVTGSVLGGRFSDRQLALLKAANGNVSYPEMRLKSVTYSASLFPLFVLAYGWLSEKHVNVAALCVFLFFCGFFSIWTYASTLAYIVDSNTGRSSSAVATNSAFRGVFAFAAIEVAVPLQDNLGDGWTYTIWAALMLISGMLIILVGYRGQGWRLQAEERERLQEGKH